MTKNNNVSTAHNNNSNGVAGDQLRAFIERIERMEEEKAAIVSDIKEIKAEARGNGFDVSIINKLLKIRKQDANERYEQEAILDLYMSALGMVAAPPEDDDYVPVRNAGPIGSSAAKLDAWAEQVADRIDPALLLTIIEGSQTEAGRKIIMHAIDAVKAGGSTTHNTSNSGDDSEEIAPAVTTPRTEPHPSKPDGSDLTTSPDPHGQVADIQPETAEQTGTDSQGSSASLSGRVGTSPVEIEAVEISTPNSMPDKSVEAPASAAPAPMYAEPGRTTYETFPPEGVVRGAISVAFGTMGQDIEVIRDDLESGRALPIVKLGNVILDGWARYTAARDMRELDGSPFPYPVVQFYGRDVLVDVIKMNVEGRILSEDQKRKIAASLARQEPSRKDDIYRAFELWLEPV